jgi:hypothetical protein
VGTSASCDWGGVVAVLTWADEPFRFGDKVSAAIGAAAALAVGELLWVGTS